MARSAKGASGTTSGPGKKGPYARDFNQAPDTLGESDEEDDIGKVPKLQPRNAANKKSSGLSYGDSDEDEEKDQSSLITLDGASSSAISRDRTQSAAENIPKL